MGSLETHAQLRASNVPVTADEQPFPMEKIYTEETAVDNTQRSHGLKVCAWFTGVTRRKDV